MTTTTETYDVDLSAVRERIAPDYIRDREADLDGSYQDEKTLNDALANTWIEGVSLAEWERLARERLRI